MNQLTPTWAMDAYNRLLSARRDVTPQEREEALKESERQGARTKIIRRLPRVA